VPLANINLLSALVAYRIQHISLSKVKLNFVLRDNFRSPVLVESALT